MNEYEVRTKYRNQAITRDIEVAGQRITLREIPYCTLHERPCFDSKKDRCANYHPITLEVSSNDKR
jgi:hypothetical protein